MRLVWVKGRFACACSACATTRPGRGPDSRAASLGRDGWSWWHQDQCIITAGEHHERVDWLAGKREEVRLLTAERVPQKASCLSSDTRMEWPASRNGISWGGKPTDKDPDLRASPAERERILCPKPTRETCVRSVVNGKWRNWLKRHGQNGKVVATTTKSALWTVTELHPAYSRLGFGVREHFLLELGNSHTALLERDARMPACGREGGGVIVAKCPSVMEGTRRRTPGKDA